MELNNTKLNNMLTEESEKLWDLGFEHGHIVKCHINKTAKRRLGQCKRIDDDSYEINISKTFIDSATEKEVRNVLMHELIHSIKGCLNHGEKWKRISNSINHRLGYNITRTSKNKGAEKHYKYKVSCCKCGETVGRYIRRSKVIKEVEKGNKHYISKCCSSKLKVESIK